MESLHAATLEASMCKRLHKTPHKKRARPVVDACALGHYHQHK